MNYKLNILRFLNKLIGATLKERIFSEKLVSNKLEYWIEIK